MTTQVAWERLALIVVILCAIAGTVFASYLASQGPRKHCDSIGMDHQCVKLN